MLEDEKMKVWCSEERVRELELEIMRMKKELGEAKREADGWTVRISDLGRDCEAVLHEKNALVQEVEAVKEAKNFISEQLQTMTQEKGSLARDFKAVFFENRKFETAHQESQASMERLEADLKAKVSELKMMSMEVEELRLLAAEKTALAAEKTGELEQVLVRGQELALKMETMDEEVRRLQQEFEQQVQATEVRAVEVGWSKIS